MKNVNDMTVEEFSEHLREMKDKLENFHLYRNPNDGTTPNRSYLNQKRGNFYGRKNIFVKGKNNG